MHILEAISEFGYIKTALSIAFVIFVAYAFCGNKKGNDSTSNTSTHTTTTTKEKKGSDKT